MNFSNELFETDPFAEDFLNESFTTNASGPDVLNESCTTNASAPVLPPAASPAQPAVIITVAVLAIVGNLLVIAVTTRRRTFPSSSRLFISSMAWSDLFAGLIFTVMVAPAGAGEWVYSDTAAQASAAIAGSSLVLSMIALAGLNLDRHYALMNDGAGVSPKKAGIFLVSAWVGIYAWYIFWTVYGVPVYYDSVMAMVSYDITANMWFTAVSFGILCSPLILTMYCVVWILKALCTHYEPPAAPVININVNGPGVPPQNANPQQQPPNNPQQQLQNNPQQQPQNNPRQQPPNNPQQQPPNNPQQQPQNNPQQQPQNNPQQQHQNNPQQQHQNYNSDRSGRVDVDDQQNIQMSSL
ncbi:rhodopsin-like [Branchiostoma lanceolatum]|uniref:rhodopsin-like n=1 Tax=Branchiostoma lanceolatum TaxID=7740 RepID=UPI003452DBE3